MTRRLRLKRESPAAVAAKSVRRLGWHRGERSTQKLGKKNTPPTVVLREWQSALRITRIAVNCVFRWRVNVLSHFSVSSSFVTHWRREPAERLALLLTCGDGT